MTNHKRLSIESFLVIMLMIFLSIAITIMILQGSHNFNKMNDSKTAHENARIAMSYINMMIKQNDIADQIKLIDDFSDQRSAIAIYHSDDEDGLATYIYFKDGALYEQYSDATDIIDPTSSVIISNLEQVKFSKNEKDAFKIDYTFGGQSLSQIIAVRTGH